MSRGLENFSDSISKRLDRNEFPTTVAGYTDEDFVYFCQAELRLLTKNRVNTSKYFENFCQILPDKVIGVFKRLSEYSTDDEQEIKLIGNLKDEWVLWAEAAFLEYQKNQMQMKQSLKQRVLAIEIFVDNLEAVCKYLELTKILPSAILVSDGIKLAKNWYDSHQADRSKQGYRKLLKKNFVKFELDFLPKLFDEFNVIETEYGSIKRDEVQRKLNSCNKYDDFFYDNDFLNFISNQPSEVCNVMIYMNSFYQIPKKLRPMLDKLKREWHVSVMAEYLTYKNASETQKAVVANWRHCEKVVPKLDNECRVYQQFLYAKLVDIKGMIVEKDESGLENMKCTLSSESNSDIVKAKKLFEKYNTLVELRKTLAGKIPADEKINRFNELYKKVETQKALCSKTDTRWKTFLTNVGLMLYSVITFGICPGVKPSPYHLMTIWQSPEEAVREQLDDTAKQTQEGPKRRAVGR